MNVKEKESTDDSVPNGEYTQFNNIEPEPSEEETQGIVHLADRGLKIQADERTSTSSFTFVIDVAKEEERRLFQIINRRLKRFNR